MELYLVKTLNFILMGILRLYLDPDMQSSKRLGPDLYIMNEYGIRNTTEINKVLVPYH
jgi:hypothetical protein